METTPPPRISPLPALLAELDAAERGFILGRLLSTGGGETVEDALVNSGLTGASAGRCAELAVAMKTVPRADRLRLVNLLAREALDPTPAGLENVHQETLRALLRDESDGIVMLMAAQGPPALARVARETLAGRRAGSARFMGEQPDDGAPDRCSPALPASPEAVTHVMRAVLAPVVAVPAVPTVPVGAPRAPGRLALRLARLSPAALLEEVATAGAALLPDPTPGDTSRDSLELSGARALGARLRDEDGDLVLAVAQRLPRALGQVLRDAATRGGDEPPRHEE